MYLMAGYEEAKALIGDALCKSPATMSRLRITFSVDDTVIDRLGSGKWSEHNSGDRRKGHTIENLRLSAVNFFSYFIRPIN
jgi:hypothetical protein